MRAVIDGYAIDRQVAEAYSVGGLSVDALPEAVAPLHLLIAAYGLTVDEVDGLTRQTAYTHLSMQSGATDEMSTEALAGFLFANAAGGWILIERQDPLVRRRFTIAHELGHYLLHFLPELAALHTPQDKDLLEFEEQILAPADRTDENETGSSSSTLIKDLDSPNNEDIDSSERERQADSFAAALIMPESTCQRLIVKYSDRGMSVRRVLARRLASEFLVSEAAMYRRLTDLQLPPGAVDGR